jgi:hypothetical protein
MEILDATKCPAPSLLAFLELGLVSAVKKAPDGQFEPIIVNIFSSLPDILRRQGRFGGWRIRIRGEEWKPHHTSSEQGNAYPPNPSELEWRSWFHRVVLEAQRRTYPGTVDCLVTASRPTGALLNPQCMVGTPDQNLASTRLLEMAFHT